MPLLRDEAVEVARRHSSIYFEKRIQVGQQASRPYGALRVAADRLATDEAERLNSAHLFFVSEEMMDLAVAASESLPDFTLSPEDLPTGWGLVYFASPIARPERLEVRGGIQTPIVAAAWGPFPAWSPSESGGVWVTWYSDRDAVLAQLEDRVRGSAMEYLRQSTARIQTDDDFQMPFSAESVPITKDGEPIALSEATGKAKWFAVLKTIWLLMGQTIATVENAKFDRAARRRIERQGKEPPSVRVITLRRPASSGSGESDREYHHQWIVRGHWRQQWYPTRQVHRPVWIAPHIKGPEGAPLLGGEKVYAWSR